MTGGNDRYGLEFSGRMLPAVLHALSIARNTALMCGSPAVQAEFKAMYEDVARQSGIPNLMRVVDEYRWFGACERISKAKEYHWYAETSTRNGKAGDVSLIVDGRQVKLEHSLPADTPNLDDIKGFLERYAHVEAVKKPDVSDWRSFDRYAKDLDAEAASVADAEDEPDAPAP